MENLFASSLHFIINVYSPHNILTVYYVITKVASSIGTLTWSTTKVASFNGSSLSAGTSASFPLPDQEEKLVSEIYPPLQLHVGVLGPGNDVLQFLEKHFL